MKNLIRSLGIAFVACQAADTFLTLWATNNGFQEVNPLMVPFAHTWALPFLKILPAALVVWGLARLGRRYPKTQPATVVGLAACVAFLGAVLVSNVGEL